VRARANRGFVQRGASSTEAKHTEVHGLRGRREPAGAVEERPHEAGGGRMSPLLPATAPRFRSVDEQSVLMKSICNGCLLAAMKRSSNMGKCPFCRTPASDNDQQIIAMMQKRVDAGDPKAMLNLGNQYSYGNFGPVKDVTKSLQLCERAADLGLKDAHYRLGFVYHFGVALRRTRPRRPGISRRQHWEDT